MSPVPARSCEGASADVSMRRTKLTASEAALLAGELTKPSWESRNEGIHERVSFEDAIWGFDLAGGVYYNTPLRVTYVKPESRAEKAGIRRGDRLLRINDIDTATLTIQEAHSLIIESGIHLKLAVTAPEDEEDAYFCYQDPIEDGYSSEEERRIEEEKAKKRQVHARVNSYWSLQWPWVSKRRVMYRESNCFMVPSKYEDLHKDKFTPLPRLKVEDDIVLYSAIDPDGKKRENNKKMVNSKIADDDEELSKQNSPQNVSNGVNETDVQGSGKLDNISEKEDEESDDDTTDSLSEEHSEQSTASAERIIPNGDDAMSSIDDDVINQVIDESGEEISMDEQDKLLNGILSDSDGQVDQSESINER